MELIRILARVADWKFVVALLLLLAAALAAAKWIATPAAPPSDGRIEIDREWLRLQAFRRNRELEAEAAREGRPVQKAAH